jgi:hypothetical protein
MGLPFPCGKVRELSQCSLLNPAGQRIPLQAAALEHWPDGTVKWALFDFQADVPAHAVAQYHLVVDHLHGTLSYPGAIEVEEDERGFHVDTGAAQFTVEKDRFLPLGKAVVADSPLMDPERSGWLLEDEAGHTYRPRVNRAVVETRGALRTTFHIEGVFADAEGRLFCEFSSRLSFFAHSALLQMTMTIRNPRRAQHPHNFWDLGDLGSIYIKDCSLRLTIPEYGAHKIAWSGELGQPFVDTENSDLEIYQDSSGGTYWDSPDHVNRSGKVMHSFCGYRVCSNGSRAEGKRAQPLVAVRSGPWGIAGTVCRFWQNFPKAIEVEGRSLLIRLFPHQYRDVHELQGGEQKTHVLYLTFLRSHEDLGRMAWARAPLIPRSSPEWYADSQAIPYLTPKREDPHHEYLRLVDAAIEGEDSFVRKREIVDEYGWRHFGDLYADHEATYYKGPSSVVSHYNNQYDAINGMAIQFFRSSDTRWFRMMDELAAHVVDIDIYHTTEDKAAYNHGLFWHTNHYVHAHTSTHRSFSKHTGLPGGGPCNEHCYTSGLMHHYLLTGNPLSCRTVIDLAQWAIAIDDGKKSRLRWLDHGYTGAASATFDRSYHGPGRGAGNAVNALLDGFILTQESRFLAKAEQLIRRCIHPCDDLAVRNLLDVERRWSYTVFLQALGRYLNFKIERGQLDKTYAYAQASLLHYACWMADHEVPYLSRPDILEYPTETWSAQDMRKSDVFAFAATHARGGVRERFLERSASFFRSSIGELASAKTRTLTRPVVLLMSHGYMQAYFQLHPEEAAPQADSDQNFGRPERFLSQRARVEKTMKWAMLLGLGASLLFAVLFISR